jgi:hypothetical protein
MEDCILEASCRMASILRIVQQQLEQGVLWPTSQLKCAGAEGLDKCGSLLQQEYWGCQDEEQEGVDGIEQDHAGGSQVEGTYWQQRRPWEEEEDEERQEEQTRQPQAEHEQTCLLEQEQRQQREQQEGGGAAVQHHQQKHQQELPLNQTSSMQTLEGKPSSRSSSRMSSVGELTYELVEERISALEEVLQRHLEDKHAAEEAGEVVLQLREALAAALATAAAVGVGSNSAGYGFEGLTGDVYDVAGGLGGGENLRDAGEDRLRGEEVEEMLGADHCMETEQLVRAVREGQMSTAKTVVMCSKDGGNRINTANLHALEAVAFIGGDDGYAEGRVEQLAVELRQAEGRHAELVTKQMEQRGEVVKVLEELQLLRLVASQELMCEEQGTENCQFSIDAS